MNTLDVNRLTLAGLVVLFAGFGCALNPSGNQPPVANAGADVVVDGGTTVTLDGSQSRDPESGSITYAWTQVAGPSVVLEESETATPSFRAPNENASLRFQLAVTDSGGASSTDSVTIAVQFADNVPPVADAGADQILRGGEVAVLDGGGSSDPDGDALTFSWSQTAGSQVALLDADTANPSFTAPNADAELVFELTVDDGNDHPETDSVTVQVLRNAPILFVANSTADSVLRFVDPGEKNGNVAPDTTLDEAATMLNSPVDIVVTRESWLIAVNRASNSLNLYLGSAVAGGDLSPFGVVTGSLTQLDQPTSIAYADTEDLVFVSNTGSSSDILVFSGPRTIVFDGPESPARVISSDALRLPADLAIDGDGRLYVANAGARNVLGFEDATMIDGLVTPDQVLNNAGFVDPIALALDSADRLYVVNSTGTVLVFENAAGLDGAVTPSATITIVGAVALSAIVVDSEGTAYVLDAGRNALYAIDNIAVRSGSVPPDRTVIGDQTELAGPAGLYIVQ